ncbi:MAG: hypothetical protein H8D65_02530 [Spirochaetes bacterium]|nr:hypothetical protein [Spirochaetota bacterium]
MQINIPVWDAEALHAKPEYLGLKGSPTRVVKIETPKVTRTCIMVKAIDEESVRNAVTQLIQFLDDRDLVPVQKRSGV